MEARQAIRHQRKERFRRLKGGFRGKGVASVAVKMGKLQEWLSQVVWVGCTAKALQDTGGGRVSKQSHTPSTLL